MFSPLVTSSTALAKPTMREVRAVPPQPGNKPELHFRKAELRFRVVGHHAPIAPDGQLRSAADANAVDRRHGDKRTMRQPLKQFAAAIAHCRDIGLGHVERRGEFAQIGPGDERPRLAGADDQAGQIAPFFQSIQMCR